MNRFAIHLLLLIAAVLSPAVVAYETDQFSGRLNDIADSTAALDERVNRSIAQAVADWSGPRDEKLVVDNIYYDIGGVHWVDRI